MSTLAISRQNVYFMSSRDISCQHVTYHVKMWYINSIRGILCQHVIYHVKMWYINSI